MEIIITNLTARNIIINFRREGRLDYISLPKYAINKRFYFDEEIIKQLESKEPVLAGKVLLQKTTIEKAQELNEKNENERLDYVNESSIQEIENKLNSNGGLVTEVVVSEEVLTDGNHEGIIFSSTQNEGDKPKRQTKKPDTKPNKPTNKNTRK